MATQIQNDKRFLVVKMTWQEFVAITDTWGLADCCGQNTSEEPVFFIATLNQFYCTSCYNAWYDTATHYRVDVEKERYNYNDVVKKLKALGTWQNE